MALNKEYFDGINIDVVKKKYYNANKVNALLEDIRRQAESLYAENQEMRTQLDALNGCKADIGEAVLSAQAIYRELVEKAELRAAEIIAEAEQRCETMLSEAQAQQDYAVSRVQDMLERLRRQHRDSINTINAEWQSFLCGLYPEDEEEDAGEKAPADLSEKVGAIAKEMLSIGE